MDLLVEITKIKQDIERVIKEVDDLEEMDKRMRQKLAEVSSKFDKYTEKDIKEVYDKTYEVRLQLMTKRNEEKLLREKEID
ncbi:hypothetical protein [Caloramator sp. mosi_1]|uniref:hypothetical protein n=1 Tax=Caloramator sp. mosi_1 TaxID=3023090 RepID=UPI003081C837